MGNEQTSQEEQREIMANSGDDQTPIFNFGDDNLPKKFNGISFK